MSDHIAQLGIRHGILQAIDHEQRRDCRICQPGRRGRAHRRRIGRWRINVVRHRGGIVRHVGIRTEIRKVVRARETDPEIEAVVSRRSGSDIEGDLITAGRSTNRADLSVTAGIERERCEWPILRRRIDRGNGHRKSGRAKPREEPIDIRSKKQCSRRRPNPARR